MLTTHRILLFPKVVQFGCSPKFIQFDRKITKLVPTSRVSVIYTLYLFRIVSHRNTFLWEIMTNECLFHSLFSIVKRKNVPVTELVH